MIAVTKQGRPRSWLWQTPNKSVQLDTQRCKVHTKKFWFRLYTLLLSSFLLNEEYSPLSFGCALLLLSSINAYHYFRSIDSKEKGFLPLFKRKVNAVCRYLTQKGPIQFSISFLGQISKPQRWQTRIRTKLKGFVQH